MVTSLLVVASLSLSVSHRHTYPPTQKYFSLYLFPHQGEVDGTYVVGTGDFDDGEPCHWVGCDDLCRSWYKSARQLGCAGMDTDAIDTLPYYFCDCCRNAPGWDFDEANAAAEAAEDETEEPEGDTAEDAANDPLIPSGPFPSSGSSALSPPRSLWLQGLPMLGPCA